MMHEIRKHLHLIFPALMAVTITTTGLLYIHKGQYNMSSQGFKMGAHQFISPNEDAPLNRSEKKKEGPIPGAIPPDYLLGKIKKPDADGPAVTLLDGKSFGHGEPTYGVFDLSIDGVDTFEIRMTGYNEKGYIVEPPYIEARPAGGNEQTWFAIYDTRRHPGSSWRWAAKIKNRLGSQSYDVKLLDDRNFMNSLPLPDNLKVFTLNETSLFRVSIGFEYPVDCNSANDVSWFTLSIQTPDRKVSKIIFSDETS